MGEGEVEGVEKVDEVNNEGERDSTAMTRIAEMSTFGRTVMNLESPALNCQSRNRTTPEFESTHQTQ